MALQTAYMNFKTKIRNLLKQRITDKFKINRLLEELLEEIEIHSIEFEEWINETITDEEPTQVLYHKFLKDGNKKKRKRRKP